MSQSVLIEASFERHREPGLLVHISDFANILKSFVGSNFLSIPFGFAQCGLALGAGGIVVIAALTIHCCDLLVRCKYHAIQHVLRRLPHAHNVAASHPPSYRLPLPLPQLFTAHLVREEEFRGAAPPPEGGYHNATDRGRHYSAEVERRLTRTMTYGDLARMCCGKWGLALTNTLILITQVGFCINYAIFTANAVTAFFPVYNCTVQLYGGGNDTPLVSPDCHYLADSPWKGVNGSGSSLRKDATFLADTTTAPDITSPRLSSNSSLISPKSTNSTARLISPTVPSVSIPGAASNPATFSRVSSEISPSTVPVLPPKPSVWMQVWTDAPDLRLLVLFPTTVFLILVLPRRLRGVGFISALGILAILTGTLFIFVSVISTFSVSDTWQWSQLKGLPIFFGTTASAYEGAGTMLPVDSSMDGNRHNFFPFLAGGMSLVTLVHVVLSVLSYLSYGGGVAQILTLNTAAAGAELSAAINVSLVLGVLLSFPIMIYPVVHLAEAVLLGPTGGICSRNGKTEEDKVLLPGASDKTEAMPVSATSYTKAAAWKRNLVRIAIVLLVGGLAVLLKDNFAYVSAFVGALGCSFVAFILPCAFHLRLCWATLPLPVKLKDLAIIVVGLVFCVTGVYAVISTMVV